MQDSQDLWALRIAPLCADLCPGACLAGGAWSRLRSRRSMTMRDDAGALCCMDTVITSHRARALQAGARADHAAARHGRRRTLLSTVPMRRRRASCLFAAACLHGRSMRRRSRMVRTPYRRISSALQGGGHG